MPSYSVRTAFIDMLLFHPRGMYISMELVFIVLHAISAILQFFSVLLIHLILFHTTFSNPCLISMHSILMFLMLYGSFLLKDVFITSQEHFKQTAIKRCKKNKFFHHFFKSFLMLCQWPNSLICFFLHIITS